MVCVRALKCMHAFVHLCMRLCMCGVCVCVCVCGVVSCMLLYEQCPICKVMQNGTFSG